MSSLSFNEAKRVCREHKVSSWQDYNERYKDIHFDLPSDPRLFYKDAGWTSWKEFLGTALLSFEQAKQLCREHKVSSQVDYKKRFKDIHLNLPSAPQISFKDKGWNGWKCFLGKSIVSFDQAKQLCKEHEVLGKNDYYKRYKDIHPQLPSNPNVVYKDSGWNGWGEFLATGTTRRTKFLSYSQAQKFCKKHKVLDSLDYHKRYKNLHPQLPNSPNVIYKDAGWNGCKDFLKKIKK